MTGASAPAPTRRSRLPSDLGPRVAVAVPAVVVLLALNHSGGLAFAIPLAVLGALGHWELSRLAQLPPAAAIPGCGAVAAAAITGLEDVSAEPRALGALLVAGALAAGVSRPGARNRAFLVTLGGFAWLGVCLMFAVMLRELPHGAGLVVDVLLATFVGDTAAQLVGSAFGRRRLAPRISPNKTVEGLAAGIVVGTLACVAASLFQDWLSTGDALLLGLACALAAPAGDLLESAIKRRAGVKDSGRMFGAHGGVLDRADAAMMAAFVGYWVARAVL